MRTFIAITSLMLTLPVFAECPQRNVESTKTIIVVPIYRTQVNYFFDDEQKEAMANVEWAFDAERSSSCFKRIEMANLGKTIVFPSLQMPELVVDVFEGLAKGKVLVNPEVGGQFHGSTNLVPVNYKAKKEILKKIQEKKNLVTMNGKVAFGYEVIKKEVVTQLKCTSEVQQGVLALHKRLGEVIKELSAIKGARIDQEAILENFLGNCVELTDAPSQSLMELSRKVKLLKGTLPIEGEVKVWTSEVIPPFHVFESTFIEY